MDFNLKNNKDIYKSKIVERNGFTYDLFRDINILCEIQYLIRKVQTKHYGGYIVGKSLDNASGYLLSDGSFGYMVIGYKSNKIPVNCCETCFYAENCSPAKFCRFDQKKHNTTKTHKKNLKIMYNTLEEVTKNKLNSDVLGIITSFL